MSFADAIAADHVHRDRAKHPGGWEPGYEYSGDGGTITATTTDRQPPELRKLLTDEGFDADAYRIIGNVEMRKWQQRAGDEFCYYWRWKFAPVTATTVLLDELVAKLDKRPPRRSRNAPVGPNALAVCIADWQAGSDHGGGPARLENRIEHLADALLDHRTALKRAGVPINKLYVLGLGDLREGCRGWAPQSLYRAQLNHEEQRRFVVAGLDHLIDRWSGQFDAVAVHAVGGNHGEDRGPAGKSDTDFSDNVDVGVFRDLEFAYSRNPERWSHVQFHLPTHDLTATFQHGDCVVGLAHGHQAKGGGAGVQGKLMNWWKGQMEGRQPIGDADILVTGHYHHTQIAAQGSRTHLMTPALCGDQDWFRHSAGLVSPPGTATFVLDGSTVPDWHRVIAAPE